MTAEKIAITVPHRTLARARQAVKTGKAKTLSAYVSRAIEHKVMLDDLDTLLNELLDASGGPLTPTEVRRADAILSSHDSPTRRNRQ